MTAWHADDTTLARYAGGTIDDAAAASIEAHLIACEPCRRAVSAQVAPARLDRMWADVLDEVDAPAPGPIERGLAAVGLRPHVARLLAATPSLRLSWLAAQAVALGTAVVAAEATAGRGADVGLFLFLVVAALLPVLGVAVAYGPGSDPAYEVGVAAPMRGIRLVTIRATAVLAASAVLAGIAAVAAPSLGWIAAAWLLPSLGLTTATLALSTAVRPIMAAGAITASWLVLASVTAARAADRLAVFRGTAQVLFVILTIVSLWVLTRRRHTFERGVMP